MNPRHQGKPDTPSIDLKHSLWTTDTSTWDDRAPGILDRMRAAFAGDGPEFQVRTAPAKEIRFGSVIVSKGHADVVFALQWDDPQDLATAIETKLNDEMTDEELDWAADAISDYLAENGDEFRRERILEAATFDMLMERVDEVEARLIEGNQEFEKDFDAFIADLAGTVKSRRSEVMAP